MKLFKKTLLAILVACSLVLVAPVVIPMLSNGYTVEAASVKLNQTSIKMGANTTYKLKVQGTSAKVKWSSSNKSIATVNNKGKVKALKTGKVTITAKVGKTKYKCKVNVTKEPKLTYKIKTTKQIGDEYYIGGKVYNKTCSNLYNANIKITLFNANGKQVGSLYTTTWWMDANGSWKFKEKVVVNNGEKVKSYKVDSVTGSYMSNYSFHKTNFDAKVTMKLDSSSSKLSDGTIENKYNVSSKITNKNGITLGDIFAHYVLYDKDGNVVGTTFRGYYKGLKNNKTVKATESIYVNSNLKPVKVKIVGIQGYEK